MTTPSRRTPATPASAQTSLLTPEALDALGVGELLPTALAPWRPLVLEGLAHFLNALPPGRQAALLAFSAFPELKHVILVDEDVDIFDSDDVLWAMQTRYQGDIDTLTIPGVRCHPLDPSQVPEYSPSILQQGMSCKTIFDCTVPFVQRDRFKRAQFMDVDPEAWALHP